MYLKSFDGTKIWYKLSKKKNPTLIFVHGWANNWTTWKKEIDFFNRKGYSTLAIDLRGHGKSDKPEEKNKYYLECFARDIQAIIKKEKIKDYIIIGHSMGGMVGLSYFKISKDKHLKGLILSSTTSKEILKNTKIKQISPFLKHVLDYIISNKKINKEYFKHMKEIDLNGYKSSSDYRIYYEGVRNTPFKSVFACLRAMLNFNVENILKKIKIPTLIIEGKKDSILPVVDSLGLYKEIKDSEIDFIPTGKHFININNPELVNKFILHFLQKHGIKPHF